MPHRPERFGSDDQEHFNAAYRQRPILNLLIMALYACVFLFAGLGVIALFMGEILKGLGVLVLAGVAFLCWAVLHNWALTHPK